MVTQMDVARRAGVSRRTVSNVVTDFPYVKTEVRERVQRAIVELGYVPNRAAQRLRTGRSGVIALLVPEVGVGYFGEIGNLIIEAAAARGVGTIVAQTRGSRTRELQEIERVLALQPDGLILSPLGLTAEDLESIQTRCPVSLIGEHFLGSADSAVAIDNVSAARELVSHLLSLGRRNIAFLGMTDDAPRFMSLRHDGYVAALQEFGVEPAGDIRTDAYEFIDGFTSGTLLAERIRAGAEIDAVFCVTDELAIGVIRALHDAGLHVPGDVAVAGFDDIAEGRYSTPRLTTVSPDKEQIARRALAVLLDGPAPASAIEYRLSIRESSAGVGLS
ncbi:LacI family DNA-binding transcriptional regulator [Microbacterium sp. P5_E9]